MEDKGSLFIDGMKNGMEKILPLMPLRIAEAAAREAKGKAVEELRLRVGRPVQMLFAEGEAMLETGAFLKSEADELLQRFCRHSVYAHAEELRAGFLTLEGGIRVGVCGRPAVDGGRIAELTEVSGFNIRIARQVIGCADGIMRFILKDGRPVSTLIASAPGGGKTTLLRDAARCLSEGLFAPPLKVAIADERCELAGCINGAPAFDVGRRTDVMDSAPKAESIGLLIRSMSPQVIVTDEIGCKADEEALAEAARCGVAVLASAHASGMEELTSRSCISALIKERIFKTVLLIERKGSMLHIAPVEV